MLPLTASDDVNRYIWEGRVAAEGFNPYTLTPDAEQLDSLKDDMHAGLNHPDYTAIYPPGFILLMQWLTPVLTPFSIKLLMGVADVLLIFVLALLLRRRDRAHWTFLYALHPLAILAFAGEGHLDVLMMLCLLSAILFRQRQNWILMWLCLGVAIQMKYVAIAAVPFFLPRASLRWSWMMVLAVALPFLPFLESGIFSSLYAFGTSFSFNGSLHSLLTHLLSPPAVTALLGVIWLLWIVHAALLRQHPESALGTVFALLLIFSPTVHYWYLSWMLPFLCFRPTRAWILWTLLISCSFLSQHWMLENGIWQEFTSATLLIYIPVYGLLAYDLFIHRTRQRHIGTAEDALPSMTVIIPVQSDLEQLKEAVASIQPQLHLADDLIIATDGNSEITDWSRDQGLTVSRAAPGRGHQIAAAAEKVSTEYLLILHADCKLTQGVLLRLKQKLRATGAQWGAVGGTFTSPSPSMRLISFLNRLRADFFGMSFGDQAQCVHTQLLKQTGGFPDQPIMEDVELCLRCQQHEPPLYVNGGVIISASAWESTSSRLYRVMLILRLFYSYLLLRTFQAKPDTSTFYRKYYESS